MDVLPLAVTTVPDASLLRLHGARHAVEVHILGEADVGDAGGFLADQVDVRVEQDGVYGLLRFGQSCGAGDNTTVNYCNIAKLSRDWNKRNLRRTEEAKGEPSYIEGTLYTF